MMTQIYFTNIPIILNQMSCKAGMQAPRGCMDLCEEWSELPGAGHRWFQWLQPTHRRAWLSPADTTVAP